jgi:hypothetical protein
LLYESVPSTWKRSSPLCLLSYVVVVTLNRTQSHVSSPTHPPSHPARSSATTGYARVCTKHCCNARIVEHSESFFSILSFSFFFDFCVNEFCPFCYCPHSHTHPPSQSVQNGFVFRVSSRPKCTKQVLTKHFRSILLQSFVLKCTQTKGKKN